MRRRRGAQSGLWSCALSGLAAALFFGQTSVAALAASTEDVSGSQSSRQPREGHQGMNPERERLEEWIADHFGPGVLPPFSFSYGGAPSAELLNDWQYGPAESAATYTDPLTGLEATCSFEVFRDFPAIEWVVTFRNGGSDDSPILEDIQALDTRIGRRGGNEFILHHAWGSDAKITDFAPIRERMPPNTAIDFATATGRSSNVGGFPFFNIEAAGEGVMVAIGWTGQWAVSLRADDGTRLNARAGMELTHLKLHPGEQIRTPRILLLFWHGDDRMRGHNLLRRFLLAHRSPQVDGKPFLGPIACSGHAGVGAEMNMATEYNQIASAERYRQMGLNAEYYWIDAGWFEGGFPNGVGNWFARKDGFPNGLRPVSDAVRSLGFKGFVLWFEPERVFEGTWIDTEHPEWVLKRPGDPNGLLDLGNSDALEWLTDHISGIIETEGIDVYRQDCNIEPLAYWRAADEPDRQGIHEIRHVEGLYAFWDELLSRHPDLLIDNCASGGRRIDLETTARSIPLWRTDYNYFEPNGYQCHTHGLSFYIPLSGTGGGNVDAYTLRSSMSSAIHLGWYLWRPGFPFEEARRRIEEIERVRHFFLGDYYPLTEHLTTNDVWMAYQYHRDDLKEGMFLAFRRPDSPYRAVRLRLRGLDPEATYALHFADADVTETRSGATLMDSLEVTIRERPGSLLVTYRELPQK